MGKRLAENNRKKREAQKSKQGPTSGVEPISQYYSIGFSLAFSAGAVLVVGVIGGLGYNIYRVKKGAASREVPNNPPNQPSPRPQTNKFEMD